MEPLDILMVEDNPGDVLLVREALGDAGMQHRLHVASDGVEAISFLHREGKYASAPCPNLILLDLNLPRRDGRDVLRDIKSDSRLRKIPAIVMTSSAAEEDIRRSYDLHANCYLTKGADWNEFRQVVHAIGDFWLTWAKLPRPADSGDSPK